MVPKVTGDENGSNENGGAEVAVLKSPDLQYGSFITTCYYWYGNKVNLNQPAKFGENLRRWVDKLSD